MSVFGELVLLSTASRTQLFIYNLQAKNLSHKINCNQSIRNAAWTPGGNIVYITLYGGKIMLVTKSGSHIVSHGTPFRVPNDISVSSDKVIYVADQLSSSIFQSKDDGISWQFVFSCKSGQCARVVKVINTDHREDYWTLETKSAVYQIRVYTIDKNHTNTLVTWRDISLPTTDGKSIDLFHSHLSCDDFSNIFLNDYTNKVIHLWSSNGLYNGQLMPANQMKLGPRTLTVHARSHLLYVGQDNGTVAVFKLKYTD